VSITTVSSPETSYKKLNCYKVDSKRLRSSILTYLITTLKKTSLSFPSPSYRVQGHLRKTQRRTVKDNISPTLFRRKTFTSFHILQRT